MLYSCWFTLRVAIGVGTTAAGCWLCHLGQLPDVLGCCWVYQFSPLYSLVSKRGCWVKILARPQLISDFFCKRCKQQTGMKFSRVNVGSPRTTMRRCSSNMCLLWCLVRTSANVLLGYEMYLTSTLKAFSSRFPYLSNFLFFGKVAPLLFCQGFGWSLDRSQTGVQWETKIMWGW